MRGVGDKKLTGRGGVSFEVKEHAIDLCLGVTIFAFGYCVCEGSIAIDELKGIVGYPQEVKDSLNIVYMNNVEDAVNFCIVK